MSNGRACYVELRKKSPLEPFRQSGKALVKPVVEQARVTAKHVPRRQRITQLS